MANSAINRIREKKRFTAMIFQSSETLAGVLRLRNWLTLGGVLAIGLSGCGDFDITKPITSIKRATGTEINEKKMTPRIFGLVASDDRVAVAVGNSIIRQGGSAADAAVAMTFTMGVTLPSRASLAGGGVCIVGGREGNQVQVLDFLPPASRARSADSDRSTAVPTMVRGMAALHSEYGKKTWRQLLEPARRFSRDGFILTKSFSDDLAALATPLFADPVSRAVFSVGDGKPVTRGRRLRQIELHTVLGQIAGRGAGDFYSGILSRRLVKSVAEAGGTLDPIELRDYLPKWKNPISVQIGSKILHTSPPPASAGIVAMQILQMAVATNGKADKSEAGQGHLFAESTRRALIDRLKWLGNDFGENALIEPRLTSAHTKRLMANFVADKSSASKEPIGRKKNVRELDASTSFVVADGSGLAVACTLTMYHLFGTGRMAPGLGLVLAAAPGENGRNALPLGPIISTGAEHGRLKHVFAASGGDTAATGMANMLFRIFEVKEKLTSAVRSARLHHIVATGETAIEDREHRNRLNGLISIGHKIKRLPKIGRVNGISCPTGLPSGTAPDCEVVTDVRGDGSAVTINLLLQGK